MSSKISILQNKSEVHYHNIPNKLKMITLPPEREAIFNYIAQIGYDKFPEFVKDILVQVEGHKLIDITDGSGDEKQDILSIAPSGRRQLTQCKHTKNYKDNSSGDGLDVLFGAAYRKDCTEVLFVTNSDLTVQAKRYITDEEYARGHKGAKETQINVDYWNGERIWERIATNSPILSKWFSGMSQAHGMRNFSFNIIIQRLPSAANKIKCEDIAENIKDRHPISALEDNLSYEIKLNDDVSFIMSGWFHHDLDTGLNYVNPNPSFNYTNVPLRALKIQVTVNKFGQYNPATYRDLIVKFIGDTALPALPENEWWHLIATTPEAFVFIQDIIEPKVISVSHAQAYVRIEGNPTSIERKWGFPQDNNCERFCTEDDDVLQWKHTPSEADITLMIEQRIHPVVAYNYYLLHQNLVIELSDYKFRRVSNINKEMIERIRRILSPESKWKVMLYGENTLLWAFPHSEDKANIQKIESAIRHLGVSVVSLDDKTRKIILRDLENNDPTPAESINSSESDLVTPIVLNKRTVWLSKEIKVDKSGLTTEVLHNICKFKVNYELQYGFNCFRGKKNATITSEEINGFLFDIMTYRGTRMLDVAFTNNILSVNLRIKVQSLKSTDDLLADYLKEMDNVINSILNFFKT